MLEDNSLGMDLWKSWRQEFKGEFSMWLGNIQQEPAHRKLGALELAGGEDQHPPSRFAEQR